MLATLSFPLEPVSGLASALVMFFAMAIGHALADFPLQGDFLSHGKNRNVTPPKLADGKTCPKHLWVYLMSAHCLIHAGFVWLISGSALLGFLEFAAHFVIDVLKCENRTSFEMDQWLHLISKLIWVGLLWGGIVTVG